MFFFYISGTFFNVHYYRETPSPYFVLIVLIRHILYNDYSQQKYNNYFK